MILDYESNPGGLPFKQQIIKHFSPELRWSPDFIVYAILGGTLEVAYRSHTRTVGQYDLLFFAPYESFNVIQASPDAFALVLTVEHGFIDIMLPRNRDYRLTHIYLGKTDSDPVYHRICHDIAVIVFNNLKDEIGSRLKLLQSLSDILLTAYENFGVFQASSESGNAATERIKEIMDYIDAHYPEKLSAADMASHLGIHPQYFSSFFTKSFHVSFIEYLTEYRINKSIRDLIYSDESILEIALNHGFSNHKTYSAAFRKLYGETPTEYRKANSRNKISPHRFQDSENSLRQTFAYFIPYLNMDSGSAKDFISETPAQDIILNPAVLARWGKPTASVTEISAGRAQSLLRSEIQQQLRMACEDIPFKYIRVRDIFSDELFVYSEDDAGNVRLNWHGLDSVFDFILSLGAKPFPEIGFMPQALAEKKQYGPLQFRPNTSRPKSMKKWQFLIRSFLTHFTDRYGSDELESWMFDFWNCPDLETRYRYWYETREEFFAFYEWTSDVFKEVNPKLKLGSPSFSSLTGQSWYQSFLEYCAGRQLCPSYISMHIYGCELLDDSAVSLDLSGLNPNVYSVMNQELIPETLSRLHTIMNLCGFRDLPVVVSDWNLSFLPADLLRDSAYMAPFIVHTFSQCAVKADHMCYWSISDIHDDFFPLNQTFQGGPGLLTYNGIKKASYNALSLLGRLGDRLLSSGDHYIFFMKGNKYQLLLYDLPVFDDSYRKVDFSLIDETHRYEIYRPSQDLRFNIGVSLPAGTYYLKTYEVSRKFGSSYDIWASMGFPDVLTRDMEKYLRDTSTPHITYSVHNVSEALVVEETVPPHGIKLLEITPKL